MGSRWLRAFVYLAALGGGITLAQIAEMDGLPSFPALWPKVEAIAVRTFVRSPQRSLSRPSALLR